MTVERPQEPRSAPQRRPHQRAVSLDELTPAERNELADLLEAALDTPCGMVALGGGRT